MGIVILAQNLDIFEGDGKHPLARTGSIGCPQLLGAGATGVILGHSEVGDGAATVNLKLKTVLKNGLSGIILVGEHWEELGEVWNDASLIQKETAKAAVRRRLVEILDSIQTADIEKIVLGYEPSWGTRGSGKEDVEPPQPAQIGEFCALMRQTISEKYGIEQAGKMRVIYGGSMTIQRAEQIMQLGDIDGLILGSAGTTTGWVVKIADAVERGAKDGRRPVLVLNWKAYALKEPYESFFSVLAKKAIDAYVAPNFVDLRIAGGLLQS